MKNALLCFVAATSLACAAPRRGILVMAHGGDDAWNRDLEATVAPVRERYPLEVAFGMADAATLEAATRRLEAQGVSDIAVVRMFLSRDSFIDQTEYILGHRAELTDSVPMHASAPATQVHAGHGGHAMSEPVPVVSQARFRISREGIAESSLIDEVLVDRVRELSSRPDQESLLILAHGAGDDAENERILQMMDERARGLAELGFAAVRCETLREDWPEERAPAEARIREFVEEESRAGRRVLVVPFRLAGFGPYRKVLDGLDFTANERGFCPHENLTRWVEEAAEQTFAGS
jgi:sirohydrochlorin cobaltochelatase